MNPLRSKSMYGHPFHAQHKCSFRFSYAFPRQKHIGKNLSIVLECTHPNCFRKVEFEIDIEDFIQMYQEEDKDMERIILTWDSKDDAFPD
jgi:hypothetical protein